MEQTQVPYDESLMAELDAWKRQEEFILRYGDKQDLDDKRFKKMKLREYDRLWFKHKNDAQTPDNQALLRVVAFHRSKLEASLYPGLIGRLAHRARQSIRVKLLGYVQNKSVTDMGYQTDNWKAETLSTQRQGATINGQQQETRRNNFKGWDYGAKKENNQGKGQHL